MNQWAESRMGPTVNRFLFVCRNHCFILYICHKSVYMSCVIRIVPKDKTMNQKEEAKRKNYFSKVGGGCSGLRVGYLLWTSYKMLSNDLHLKRLLLGGGSYILPSFGRGVLTREPGSRHRVVRPLEIILKEMVKPWFETKHGWSAKHKFVRTWASVKQESTQDVWSDLSPAGYIDVKLSYWLWNRLFSQRLGVGCGIQPCTSV